LLAAWNLTQVQVERSMTSPKGRAAGEKSDDERAEPARNWSPDVS
jgi:hypothetical protein